MSASVIIGSIGVTILLLAFVLVLFKWLKTNSFFYSFMNFSGAVMAGYASILIDYLPFVILEGAWAAVALLGMIRWLTTDRINEIPG